MALMTLSVTYVCSALAELRAHGIVERVINCDLLAIALFSCARSTNMADIHRKAIDTQIPLRAWSSLTLRMHCPRGPQTLSF